MVLAKEIGGEARTLASREVAQTTGGAEMGGREQSSGAEAEKGGDTAGQETSTAAQEGAQPAEVTRTGQPGRTADGGAEVGGMADQERATRESEKEKESAPETGGQAEPGAMDEQTWMTSSAKNAAPMDGATETVDGGEGERNTRAAGEEKAETAPTGSKDHGMRSTAGLKPTTSGDDSVEGVRQLV